MEEKKMPDPVRRDLVYRLLNGFLELDTNMVRPLEKREQINVLVERIYQHRIKHCARVSVDFEDEDLEVIVSTYEELNRLCGILMYNQGWYDANQTIQPNRNGKRSPPAALEGTLYDQIKCAFK